MTGAPFFSWQHAILKSALESTTKLVLHTINAHMASDGTGCFPSFRLIADESGLSRSTVILHVQKAADAGFLAITNRDRDNGSHSSNLYLPMMPGGGPAAGLGVVRQLDQGSPAKRPGVVRQPDPHNNSSEQPTEPTPIGPKGPCAWEEDFGFMSVVDAFKAVRVDRVDLKRSWEIWEREGFTGRAEAICNAIRIMAGKDDWKKEGRRFVPRLSRFLFERNWMLVSKDMLPAADLAEERQRKQAEFDAYCEAERKKRMGF